MMDKSSFDTAEALRELGFKPDSSFLSDDGEGLSYDFGNLTLSASRLLNRHFAEIISVSGIYVTPRTIAEVEIQLPLRVSSLEQCAAFIAWGINKQIGRNFVPLLPTHWLDKGRDNFDTLPWVKEQKLYQERPKCTVEREWLKLALRDLRSLLPQLEESELLTLSFQNEIFSIRSSLKLIALPATGKDWKSRYDIAAAKFRGFPKRFNNKEIGISVWNNHLYLAGRRYPIDKIVDNNEDMLQRNRLLDLA